MKPRPVKKLLISLTLICITVIYIMAVSLFFNYSPISKGTQAITEIERKVLPGIAFCKNDQSSIKGLNYGLISRFLINDFYKPGDQGTSNYINIANHMDINTYVLI